MRVAGGGGANKTVGVEETAGDTKTGRQQRKVFFKSGYALARLTHGPPSGRVLLDSRGRRRRGLPGSCTVVDMGITGLLPLLKPVTKRIHISELKGLVSFWSRSTTASAA